MQDRVNPVQLLRMPARLFRVQLTKVRTLWILTGVAAKTILLFCCSVLLIGATPASSQMDERTKGAMQYFYRSLILAEHNLKIAADQRDSLRALLINDLVFSLQREVSDQKRERNVCIEALEALGAVTVAVAFALHPANDDLFNRFSKAMRPTDGTLVKWFDEGSSKYVTKIASCEEAIRFAPSPRALPEKLPETR